jgi:hypothetical protein
MSLRIPCRDIVPLGKIRTNFNFSLEDKRILVRQHARVQACCSSSIARGAPPSAHRAGQTAARAVAAALPPQNMENLVNDNDNIKQDMSIDVYGRKKAEEYGSKVDASRRCGCGLCCGCGIASAALPSTDLLARPQPALQHSHA